MAQRPLSVSFHGCHTRTDGVARCGHDSDRSIVEPDVLAFAEEEINMRLCTFVRVFFRALTTGT